MGDTRPLDKGELAKVVKVLSILQKDIERVIQFLQYEMTRTPQNLQAYEREYQAIDVLLDTMRRHVRQATGWFSSLNRLSAHVKSKLAEIQEALRRGG